MNKANSTQQQDGEPNEGSYENYRSNSLPGQASEAVYDRYNSAYAGDDSEQEPKTCFRITSRCKIGWLLHLSKIIRGLKIPWFQHLVYRRQPPVGGDSCKLKERNSVTKHFGRLWR